MKLFKSLSTLCAILLIGGNAFGANCGDGVGACACGDTLTADYALPSDINCPTSATALTIGADNLTLNGGGYTMSKTTEITWTGPDGNGEYHANAPADVDGGNDLGKYILLIDGVPINAIDDDSHGSLSAGYWCLETTSSPDVIYYKPDGETPGEHTYEFGQGVVIDLDGYDNVVITNLELYGAKDGIWDNSTGANRPDGLDISDVEIYGMSAHGIFTAGDTNAMIDDTEIYYTHKGGIKLGFTIGGASEDKSSDGAKITNCNFHDIAYNYAYYSSEMHSVDIEAYGDDAEISDCVFTNNGRMGGLDYTSDDKPGAVLSIDGVDNPDVSNNRFINNYQGCVVFGPDGNHASTGGQLYKNIFVGNGRGTVDSLSRSERLRTVQSKNDSGGPVNIDFGIINNTFKENEDDEQRSGGNLWQYCAFTLRLYGASAISGVTLKNNVFENNTTYADLRIDDDVTYTENNNCYYRSAGGDYLGLGDVAANPPDVYPSTNSFANFKTATGGDLSLNVYPKLTSSYIPRNKTVANGGYLGSWLDSSCGFTRYGDGPPIGAKELPEHESIPRIGPPFVPIIGWDYYTP
jgi:hypothetical protein